MSKRGEKFLAFAKKVGAPSVSVLASSLPLVKGHMKKFTDLLDNYLLALGIHNQAHALHEHDPLRFAQDYREAGEALKIAKEDLNNFVDSLKEPVSNLIEP